MGVIQKLTRHINHDARQIIPAILSVPLFMAYHIVSKILRNQYDEKSGIRYFFPAGKHKGFISKKTNEIKGLQQKAEII
ncbi:hypothetical protein EDI28_06270 [Photobacterium chitinilyticum]|uniref:Uncharacterized protein n=1 Tax=Photobacterium chitinilyticum TaxID=2485123 RepID=A0A444JX12_9GAMM|nr:hypothetical protein EDI28_06270 [Photobacterium chitinilyticum]